MGADSVLVNAAYKLGQSNVPGDYSDIFNKQYEGLIAYNKARYKTIGDAFKVVGEQVEKINTSIDNRKKADIKADNLLFNETYETAATDVANAKMKKSNKQFEEGSPQNMAHVNAANTKFESLKSQLSVLADKTILSKADKKLQSELRGKAEKMKKNLVKAKGTVITNTSAYSEGHINNALSFDGSPDEQLLFAQVHDPDADLESLGVRVYWDDNEELQYEYTPNRLQKEYEQNKRKDAGGDYSPILGEFAPGNTKTISANKLASMMVLKDVKANADANALLTKAGTHASEVIGKTKNLAHADFSRVETSIYNDYNSLFLNEKTNIQDITTRETLVGNTNRIYKNDIGSNGGITRAIVNQLGIGSDVFTEADLNGNGKLDANELEKHEGAKAEIIEKLTNPQTRSEREVAASELARYWTLHAKAEFEYIRKQNEPTITTISASKFETFLGNTVEIPTTYSAKKDKALIENIAKDYATVTVNGVEYERVNGDGYDYRAIKDKGGKITSGGDEVTKEYLIRSVSPIYGKIDDGYFGESTYKAPKVKFDPSSNQTTIEQMKAALPKGTNLDRSDEEIRKAYKKYYLSLAK